MSFYDPPLKEEVDHFVVDGEEYQVDLPVCVAFWNRPPELQSLLSLLMVVKPSILIFYQNGIPSERLKDSSFRQCRDLLKQFLSKIDWSCSVFTYFPNDSLDIWHSLYRCHSFAFSVVDRCVILEDDCLPSVSWFKMASYLLDRFSSDPKVSYILSELNCGTAPKFMDSYDYVFSTRGPDHGWATWRRAFNEWDITYSWLDDRGSIKKIQKTVGRRKTRKLIKRACYLRENHIPDWELYRICQGAIFDSYSIIPTRNMLLSLKHSSATHPADFNLLTNRERQYFLKPSFDVSFPLREPPLYLRDNRLDRSIDKAIEPSFLGKIKRGFSLFKKGQLKILFRKSKKISL